MDSALIISGSNIVANFTALASSGAGEESLTTKVSIFQTSNSRYWDDGSGDFDSVAEVLNTAPHIVKGLYEYSLTNGVILGTGVYRVRFEVTDTITGDFYDASQLVQTVAAPQFIRNVAYPNFSIFMVQTADPNLSKPGIGDMAGEFQQDDGSFSSLTNTIFEIGNGMYRVDLTAAEMNAPNINLRFTGTDAVTRVMTLPTNV